MLGQEARHPLMRLYAQALRDLGRFLGARSALDLVAEAGGSAERLATALARGMAFFDDRGFYKRAQIVPNDLALAGVAQFADLDRLTIFADNLVPHVLRVDGVLRYEPCLAALIDAERLLPAGEAGARDPGLRPARLRADRRAQRHAAAGARRGALEPRPGAALQGDPAPPHALGLLLSVPAPSSHGAVGLVREQPVHAQVQELLVLGRDVPVGRRVGPTAQLGGQEHVLAPEGVDVHQQPGAVRAANEARGRG